MYEKAIVVWGFITKTYELVPSRTYEKREKIKRKKVKDGWYLL